MNFIKVINKRNSVRKYSTKKVSQGLIDKLLKAVKAAPSAGDLQAYKIVVVMDDEIINKLISAAHGMAFLTAGPVVLVFCALPSVSEKGYGQRGRELYAIQDATIACAYAQLAAVDLGLSSCWVGSFDELSVRQILGLDDDKKVIALLPVGYAD